jgi:hypothetical protein
MGSSWSKPSREAMPDRYVRFIKWSFHGESLKVLLNRQCFGMFLNVEYWIHAGQHFILYYSIKKTFMEKQ